MAASDQIPGQEFEYVALRCIFFSLPRQSGIGIAGMNTGTNATYMLVI